MGTWHQPETPGRAPVCLCAPRESSRGSSLLADIVTRVDDRTLTLTNLDKVLYPSVGFTKAR